MPDRPPGTAAVADLVDLVRVHYCVNAHWTSCRSWRWGEQASPRLARSRQIPGALARHAQTAGCGSVFTLVVPNEYLRRFADQARKEYEVLIVRRAVGVCDVVRLGEHVRVRRSSPEGRIRPSPSCATRSWTRSNAPAGDAIRMASADAAPSGGTCRRDPRNERRNVRIRRDAPRSSRSRSIVTMSAPSSNVIPRRRQWLVPTNAHTSPRLAYSTSGGSTEGSLSSTM